MLRDTAVCKSSINYVYDIGGKNVLQFTLAIRTAREMAQ
jgi:hypothetical protein